MSWSCPYCQTIQIPSSRSFASSTNEYAFGTRSYKFETKITKCLNLSCGQISITVDIFEFKKVRKVNADGSKSVSDDVIETLLKEQLLPRYYYITQPDFIPKPLVLDYYEACSIRSLSPKASATLARRCLQGMIRDFCGISCDRLIDEIRELRKVVTEGKGPAGVSIESVDAIDGVRKVGNIGAHMEKNINKIIDVDDKEAELLLKLIELLFKEWYIERENRRSRLIDIARLAERVEEDKKKHRSD